MLKMKFSPKRPGVFKTSQDKILHPQAWNSGNLAREFPACIYWYQITINSQVISIKSH